MQVFDYNDREEKDRLLRVPCCREPKGGETCGREEEGRQARTAEVDLSYDNLRMCLGVEFPLV